MKTVIKAVVVASVFAFAGVASAAEVTSTGDVKTDVNVGNIKQDAGGLGGSNKIVAGSVTGSSKVAGKVDTKVKTGKITQEAGGLGGSNEVKLGTVSSNN